MAMRADEIGIMISSSNTVAWQAPLASGGMPRPTLEKLNEDVNAAVHSPQMKAPLESSA